MDEIRDMEKVYLGDAVYAECRFGMLVLTTENGLGSTNKIYLEPEVLTALRMMLDAGKEDAHQAREKCIGETLSVSDMKDLGLKGDAGGEE